MPLVTGQMKEQLKQFILTANKTKQTDLEKSVDNWCNQLEQSVYAAIKSMTITINPGTIIVAGGPTTQSNVAPITISVVTAEIT